MLDQDDKNVLDMAGSILPPGLIVKHHLPASTDSTVATGGRFVPVQVKSTSPVKIGHHRRDLESKLE